MLSYLISQHLVHPVYCGIFFMYRYTSNVSECISIVNNNDIYLILLIYLQIDTNYIFIIYSLHIIISQMN